MLIPILSVFLLFLAFICRRDRVVFSLLLAFMAIVMSFNAYNIDWDAYELLYSLTKTTTDIGFTDRAYDFLTYISQTYLSWDFFQFRAVIMLAGLLLIGRSIVKYSPYPSLVLALYFIAPFFPNDIIQIRNFLAQAVLCTFLCYWIDSDRKRLYPVLAGVVLAGFLHASAFFFAVVLLLFVFKDDKKIWMLVLSASFLVGLLPYILRLVPFISVEKINFYLGSEGVSGIGYRNLVIVAIILIQLYLSYLMKQDAEASQNSRYQTWAKTVYHLNILAVLSCAIILVWSFNFYRIPRNLLIFNYLVHSMYLAEHKDKGIFNLYTAIYMVLGLGWSLLNSYSQWQVLWQNNALFTW